MSIDYNALRAELLTDPAGIGYAAAIAAGDHTTVASLLAAVPAGAVATWRASASSDALRSRVAKADFAALTAADKQFLEFLLAGGTVDTTVAQLRTDIAALFPGGSPTRAAWLATAQFLPTRAEALFGEGTTITDADIGRALL